LSLILAYSLPDGFAATPSAKRARRAVRAMRVGITNQKGGVAKTTTTINTAGALADRGLDVLAVDADPQGYLTNRLGFGDVYTQDGTSLFDAFCEPRDHELTDLVVEHDEFDVLPSNGAMFRVEQELIAAGWKPRERLRILFDAGGADEWDAVLVDAPPSLGPVNDNVLLACENLLIPVSDDKDMMNLALRHLLNQIETLEHRYDTRIRERGLVVSDVDYPLDNEQAAALEWFYDRFDGRCPVFEIRTRAALKRTNKRGSSIFHPDAEECDMTDAYAQIVAEVMPDE